MVEIDPSGSVASSPEPLGFHLSSSDTPSLDYYGQQVQLCYRSDQEAVKKNGRFFFRMVGTLYVCSDGGQDFRGIHF